ncbi:hypothetical protein NZD89_15870 [Alicyclobacillus fastidiosus]|uniref:DUF4129 domain-containing protein n=1 Tax=Alicyclobacillus fastidiosus TaxID=392011 RepID=A0ABY6ZC95_9BACL|nr:hypothetical protein [Alicyclobacillus fastidiosus]WAH39876.1 hypothetical protein NZD89_15870 [Alicyclobacillus fastidiosus]GMA61145.1 hypothetical protein GCM10025859_15850 [Alicyclobacillus fastidiosus]
MAKSLRNARFRVTVLRYPLLQATIASFSCLVAFLPLPLVVGAYVIKPGALWLWLVFLFLLAFVGAWFGIVVRRFNPVLKSLSVAAIALVWCAFFADTLGRMPFAASFALCAMFVVPASIMGANGLRMLYSNNLLSVWLIGLLVHFAAFFLVTYLSLLRPEIWIITVSAFVTVSMVVYALNQFQLNSLLSDGQAHVPSKVRTFNRLLVTMFLGIVLLTFACFAFFVNLSDIERAISSLLQHLFPGGQQQTQSRPIHTPTFKFPKQPDTQTHQSGPATWQHIVSIIIAVASFVGLLFLLVRGLHAVWKWYQRHRGIETYEPTGYVDKEESIAGESHRMGFFRRDRRRRHELAWNELSSPEEQVRYLYRQFVRRSQSKGYTWVSADTALETTEGIWAWLEEKDSIQVRPTEFMHDSTFAKGCRYLEELYDKARYGQGGITKDEVEHLRDMMGM